jgi:hypothetical protein
MIYPPDPLLPNSRTQALKALLWEEPRPHAEPAPEQSSGMGDISSNEFREWFEKQVK